MIYRLTVSYRGTHYAGWQRQTNAVAVQQVLEEALEELLRRPMRVAGSSRTDAGVHARGQVVHLELDQHFPIRGLIHGTNRALPSDIRVMAAERMCDGFHARKSARAKSYSYRLRQTTILHPLDALDTVAMPPPRGGLDLAAMRQATAALVGEHDFTAFALAGGSHRTAHRRIFAATWQRRGKTWLFRVVGSGFLRGMVRGLAGTLIEIGQGRRPANSMAELLTGQPRSAAGPTAPAHGLTLERVHYPPGFSWRDPSAR